MPKVTEVKKAYPIFKKDMKKYKILQQDPSAIRDREAIRKKQNAMKRKSTGEHSASKLNRFCIGMFSKIGIISKRHILWTRGDAIISGFHAYLKITIDYKL